MMSACRRLSVWACGPGYGIIYLLIHSGCYPGDCLAEGLVPEDPSWWVCKSLGLSHAPGLEKEAVWISVSVCTTKEVSRLISDCVLRQGDNLVWAF